VGRGGIGRGGKEVKHGGDRSGGEGGSSFSSCRLSCQIQPISLAHCQCQKTARGTEAAITTPRMTARWMKAPNTNRQPIRSW